MAEPLKKVLMERDGISQEDNIKMDESTTPKGKHKNSNKTNSPGNTEPVAKNCGKPTYIIPI